MCHAHHLPPLYFAHLEAMSVQSLMADVVAACEHAVAEVFPKLPEKEKQQQDAGEGWKATGGEGVFQDFIEDQAKKLEAPIVTGMEKLALLGS